MQLRWEFGLIPFHADSHSIDIHGAHIAGKCGGSEAASTLLLDQCHVIWECLWSWGFSSSILGLAPCLYDCTSKRAVHISDLKENEQQTDDTQKGNGRLAQWSRKKCYKIGKKISEKLNAVSVQISKGRLMRDERVGMIGLYGMGVKTFRKLFGINYKSHIVYGKLEARVTDEKAAEIFRVLSTKKFVLLLDDVWERLGLLEIGVPYPDAQNKSKIVFTTRSKDVCHQMKAQKSMEVACLASGAAWTLFQKERTAHANTPPQVGT
ncbi:putative disease resistance protein [Vitis vinifera]|uniref:Putative disease resistance protein n=1 Tax=Vitis vinifera TaxID=29760 RepID=A0A438GZP3_VITVI|nr:putative disease resistance protein [Vitis vinifera]